MSLERRIRFGCQLIQEKVEWSELEEACLRIEEMGFDSVWAHDHFIPSETGPSLEGPCMEGWAVLAAWAAKTKRLRLGSLVSSVTFRNPAVLAKMAATVDIISGGRLEFGLGAGWGQEEHSAYGIPFYTLRERLERMGEAVELIKMLWTSDGNCSFNGRYYQLKEAPFDPKPLQKPHPPITIGGQGEKVTLRIAAQWADAVNLYGTPQVIRHKISVLKQHCETVGRDHKEIEIAFTTRLIPPQHRRAMEPYLRATAFFNDITLEEAEGWMLTGNLDRVRDRIKQYVELGVTHIILGFCTPYDFDSLQGFVDEVVPAFR